MAKPPPPKHCKYKATYSAEHMPLKLFSNNIQKRDGLKLLTGFSSTTIKPGVYELIVTWSVFDYKAFTPLWTHFKIYESVSDCFVAFYNCLKWEEVK